MKTVAVLHTTPVTIAGLKPHFQVLLPNVRVLNFLDDSILPEINEAGCITPLIRYRFHSLMRQAALANPDLILSACSSVGGMLEEGRALVSMPAVRIDEPMLKEAVQRGKRIAVAATLSSTLMPTMDFLKRCANEANKEIIATPLLLAEAGQLLSEGKTEEYTELVYSKIAGLLAENDIVVLAQASMAGALQLLPENQHSFVLTSPESGIAALNEML